MRDHRVLRGVTALTLALALLFHGSVLGAPKAAAESISDLKARLSALEEQEAENADRLDALREDASQKRAYRDAMKEKIDIVQQQLDVLIQRIRALDDAILEGEAEIADTKASISANFDKLKDRLKTMYMTGDATTLSILLRSTSLVDYQQKSEVIRAITDHDTALLDTLEADLHSIEDKVEEINAQKYQLGEDKKALDSKSKELSALYEESERLLQEAEANEAEAQAEAERIALEKAETDAAIDQWYAEYYAALEAANKNAAGGVGYIGTGAFVWPMPGYTMITCYFGEDGHRGIDIAGVGIYGKDIVAADAGKVIYAGWMGSYGNCVFIDHGNGYSTRYAHASALAVSEGDEVQIGQTIAYVGSTGNSTGPHLHFEVLYSGSLTDPFNYF